MHDDDFYHECMGFQLGVRAIAEELPDDAVLEVILLDSEADSGADVSVFPMSLIMQGCQLSKRNIWCTAQKYPNWEHDTGGNHAFCFDKRFSGAQRKVVISSKVTWPILCLDAFLSRVLERRSWASAFPGGGQVNIPLQMQNKSMTVWDMSECFKRQPTVMFQRWSEWFEVRWNKRWSTAWMVSK